MIYIRFFSFQILLHCKFKTSLSLLLTLISIQFVNGNLKKNFAFLLKLFKLIMVKSKILTVENCSRDYTIDFLKGIGILSVILGHTVQLWPIRSFIYTFHMPLFFMASGYFYRKRPGSKLCRQLLKSLIVPYLIICVLLKLFNIAGGGGFVHT